MTSPAHRRLLKDYQKIQNQDDQGIAANPDENNFFKWTALIQGVQGTPWQDGVFDLSLQFNEKYPNQPPKVQFTCQMFHPNIYPDGRICLDMLGNQWSPNYDVWAILTSIRTLLADPNILSPAHDQAAKVFNQNKNQYQRRVKKLVQKLNNL